ncbi:hypothetical protein K443DRAFT_671197 [Laccaria amethystina LaAM-08-1]|uniref:Uncharacterized protein n=1 Tax=Laccaria amethystina LaAM-08-1 TaxID=1095629 RepID=A0A0C9YHQ8_9AGAR|nr:hypothetical protein K443DRAFT_671197 [Laccaria amethystina LaAM-08-1]
MIHQPPGSVGGLELEMGPFQCNLVDSCFEEGQHEAAISMLEQLRSPNYKPSISHIRQLIFIALHSSRPSLDGPKDKSIFESPRKFAAKQQKESHAVGPGAAAAAIQLLESFVATNSPDALGRALPHYPSVKNIKSNDASETTDSTLAKQSLCIKEAKNCWDILVEGFTLGASQNCSSSKCKGKQRQEFFASESFSEDPLPQAQVVGKDSWPLLSWLVDLFERDESLLEQRGQPRHSPLLVEQLPPPRGESATRWDTTAPLDVVFYCLEQSDLRRQRIGYRLMTLMINLTSTIYLDLSMFAASVYGRLSTAGMGGYSLLSSNLLPSISVRRFTIAFCLRLVSDGTFTDAGQISTVRPKPQARLPPKARIAHNDEKSPLPRETGRTSVVQEIQSCASKYLLPNCSEVLRLLELELPGKMPPEVVLRMKFDLLTSYASLQAGLPESTTFEWRDVLQVGRLGKAIETAFGRGKEGEANLYLQILQNLLPTW